jgi:large subunit ribosomal protein L24
MLSRIRKGDMVAIVSGDDRGKRGRVLRLVIEKNRVVVEGVNLVYRHLRRSQQHPQGGRVRREAALHISNVMPIDPETNKPTRVGMKVVDGKRVQVARRSGADLRATPAKGAKSASKGEKKEK